MDQPEESNFLVRMNIYVKHVLYTIDPCVPSNTGQLGSDQFILYNGEIFSQDGCQDQVDDTQLLNDLSKSKELKVIFHRLMECLRLQKYLLMLICRILAMDYIEISGCIEIYQAKNIFTIGSMKNYSLPHLLLVQSESFCNPDY